MYAVVLDAEMTDNRPGQLCQLAYITVGDGGVLGKNHYFAVDEVTEAAFLVHGLGKERLQALSGGVAFALKARDIARDLAGASVLIGHNIGADARFLQTEMERAGVPFTLPPLFCTMKATTDALRLPRRFGDSFKPPRLSELCAAYGVGEKQIQTLSRRLFGKAAAAHDARYDAAACCLCCVEGIARGDLPPLFSFQDTAALPVPDGAVKAAPSMNKI